MNDIIPNKVMVKLSNLINNMESDAKQAINQTQDEVDIIDENFNVETSKEIKIKLSIGGILDRIKFKARDIFG